MYPGRRSPPSRIYTASRRFATPANDIGLAQVVDELDDVQLDRPVEAGVLVQRGQLRPEVLLRVFNGAQPVVDRAMMSVAQCCFHAPATVVATYDEVVHLQHVYRILQYREQVHVGLHDQVRDVPVHEHVAWIGARDTVRCNRLSEQPIHGNCGCWPSASSSK